MKRAIFLVLIILPAVLSAQHKLDIISSAGGFYTTSQISISWTLGETIIPNYEIPGVMSLVHGFQHKLIITKVTETIEDPVILSIYPNPASEIVRIEFGKPVEEQIRLSLIDFKGGLVISEILGTGTISHELNVQQLSPGIYYIRLQTGRLVNTYRLVKL